MDMQPLAARIVGRRIGPGRMVIVPVRMRGAGVVVRVDLALPEPGQKQAKH
jgi:hypothetical protein